MSKLFVDTWGWLTLYDKRESQHRRVADFYTNFRAQVGNSIRLTMLWPRLLRCCSSAYLLYRRSKLYTFST